MLNNLKKRIREIRKIKKLSQEDLARLSGIPQPMISRYERGEAEPLVSNIIRIAKALNVSFDWLLVGETRKKEIPTIIAKSRKPYEEKKLIAIPVINEVPAGYPTYPEIVDFIRTYIYLPDVPKKSFGLFVNGESMEPEIFDGDIVILNPTIERIKRGDLGVFRVNMDVSLKRYLPTEKGIFLQPANQKFAPIFVSNEDECELIGKVIYKILKYR